ncbi:hypothetical protein FM102_12715 [Corynebacterium glutamicum]|nr:hypothetical protein FM102_12715 [Corynebacterium glutamicum]
MDAIENLLHLINHSRFKANKMAGTMRVLPVSGLHARPFWVVELIV